MLKLVVSAFLILLIVALTTGAARRLMPHELRAAPVLDEAARLLALACDLDLQGLDQYAGPLVLEASRLLARADFLLRGSAA